MKVGTVNVGDGVIIDASRLGMNGGQLVGIVEAGAEFDGQVGRWVRLPRKVEEEMAAEAGWGYGWFYAFPWEITATIPNCEGWLGKEMR